MGDSTPSEKQQCPKCGEVKPLDAFGVNRTRRDGRQYLCKECRAAYRAANRESLNARARERHAANRDRLNATAKAYYEAKREERRARQAEYRAANREKIRAKQAEYRTANREKMRDYLRDYAKKNRFRLAEYDYRRRAKIKANPIDPREIDALWTGLCGICGESMSRDRTWPHPEFASIDHIVPLSKGGRHELTNLQWAHLICNQNKGARIA